MSRRKITKADLVALRAGVVFARDEVEQLYAERALMDAKKIAQLEAENPSNRPPSRELHKERARKLIELLQSTPAPLDRKSAEARNLCKQAAMVANVTERYRSLRTGLQALIDDRHIDDAVFSEPDVLDAIALVELHQNI